MIDTLRFLSFLDRPLSISLEHFQVHAYPSHKQTAVSISTFYL